MDKEIDNRIMINSIKQWLPKALKTKSQFKTQVDRLEPTASELVQLYVEKLILEFQILEFEILKHRDLSKTLLKQYANLRKEMNKLKIG